MPHLAALPRTARSAITIQVTDGQTVVAAIAGVAGTIAGAILGAIRRSGRPEIAAEDRARDERQDARAPDQATDRAISALIENTRSLATLEARIGLLIERTDLRSESTRDLAASVGKLEIALAEIQACAARLGRSAEILERDARLDDKQRAALAKIRTKIARGLLASHTAQAGSSGEDDS